METITLGDLVVTIDEETKTITSHWPDGTTLDACPVYDEESIERAKALGYGITYKTPECRKKWQQEEDEHAVWAMTRDHDLFHHFVARAEGQPWSWHLHYVAGGEMAMDDISKLDGDREERLVLLLQRGVNLGTEGMIG